MDQHGQATRIMRLSVLFLSAKGVLGIVEFTDFIAMLKEIDGEIHYLYQGNWYPVTKRAEKFKVKGADDVIRTVYTTRHGPSLNTALKNEKMSRFECLAGSGNADDR